MLMASIPQPEENVKDEKKENEIQDINEMFALIR